MLLQAKQLIGLPVGASDTQSREGTVKGLVFDADDGRVLGFLIKQGIFGKPKALAFTDVTAIDHTVVVTRDPENVLPVDEIVRLKHAVDEKKPILGQKVTTESGINLGKIEDVVVNTTSGQITKLYVRHMLEDRVIGADKIVKITRDQVIVKDDAALGRAQVTETAIA
jgi:uncharacterized protein YrrD